MPTQVQPPHTPHPQRGPGTAPTASSQPQALRGPVLPVEKFAAPTDSDGAPTASSSSADRVIDLKALSTSLLISLADCQTREAARTAIVRFIGHLLNPTAIHLWRVSATGQVAAVDAPDVELPSAEIIRLCPPDVQSAVRQRGTSITELDRLRNLVALSLPVGRNIASRDESGQQVEATEVLTVILLLGSEPLESFLVIIQLLCGYLTLWELEAGSKQLREIAQIDQFLLKTIVQMTESGSAIAAARVGVEELRKEMTVGQAAIGVADPQTGSSTLLALSGAADIDPRTELSRAVRDTLEDAQQRGSLHHWKPEPTDTLDSPCVRLARLTGANRILTGPLREIDDRVVGSWVIYGNESLDSQPVVRHAFIRGERALARIVTRKGRWGSAALLGSTPPSRWKRGWPLITGIALCGAMWVPVPHRVTCDSQVQPQTRRFVAAPFAGVLRKVHSEAGDLVREGDLLAEMDDTELRLELTELQAEVDRLTRSRDVNRADNKEVDAVLDGHKLRQAEARLALLASREQHLLIRSPVGGVILSEDLKRAEGIPVRIGQSLFEVAPLDEMRLELRIPADQIGQITVGQAIEVGFVSQTTGPIETHVDRVLPNAEIVEGSHVFLALADISNEGNTLRPGEHGQARIVIGQRQLWWILFHRPWQKLRTQWGWSW